jgi:hypothetical protein
MSRALGGSAAVLVTLAALLPTVPAEAASTGKELDLRFEAAGARTNSGVSVLTVRTVSAHGGTVRQVGGFGGGSAIRLPAFATGSAPMAVMSAVDQQGQDDLSPGTARFRFGADFTLDAQSQGSSVDNGNNLIQRGSFRAAMQYKVEIDGRRPGCRVKGSAGAVSVRSPREVTPDTWYRVKCLREGPTVTLRVVRLADHTAWTYRRSGPIGSVQTPRRSLPLSVGGKVNARGGIATSSSDQFNGRIDNAFVNVFS